MQRLQPTHPLGAFPQLRRVHFFSPQNQAGVAAYLAHLRTRHYALSTQDHALRALKCFAVLMPEGRQPICNLRGTAALRRQGDRSGLTRAQRPSEAQSNKLCDPSMGEQNLLSKAASFRGQWFT